MTRLQAAYIAVFGGISLGSLIYFADRITLQEFVVGAPLAVIIAITLMKLWED